MQVDYNGELQTVGLANLLTSIVGAGFTGSYIFSQTIWSQRCPPCAVRIEARLLNNALVLQLLVCLVQIDNSLHSTATLRPCS